MRELRLIVFSFYFVFGVIMNADAQTYSVTLTTDKCSHIASNLTTNQNSFVFRVGTFVSSRGSLFNRAFIEFDVSSIPSNAIVYEATLKITHDGSPFTANPWVTKLITSSWTETGVTPSLQPSISSNSSDWETNYSSNGNTENIDVLNTVQRMVYEQIPNYGWSIQVSNEAVSYTSGTQFQSDEAATSQPELVVKYYLPVTLSNVIISHESGTSANDGEIDFDHTSLDATGHSYQWFDASNNLIGSNKELTGVPYGWYGVEVTGNTNQETQYFAFIVGTECKEVSIEFAPDANYIDNAFNNDFVNNGIDFGDWNSGDNVNFQTSRETANGVDFSSNSLMRFRLWMPDDVIVSQSNLTLHGISHSGSNSANFEMVNSYWDESLVSWNNPPTSATPPSANLPIISSSSDAVVDMTDFWNVWKQDNPNNQGVIFELNGYGSPTKTQRFHSPTANAADRPTIDFKIRLWEQSCMAQYGHLDYELDGYYHIMKDGMIRFIYDQEYDTDDLEFNIYNRKDELVKTEADFTAITTTTGDNYLTIDVSSDADCIGRGFFYLEIINSKKEKLYLRFLNDFTNPNCTDYSIEIPLSTD